MWAEKTINLSQPLSPAKAEMSRDDLHIRSAEIYRSPESPSRFRREAAIPSRQGPRFDELGGTMGENGIAIFLLQHSQTRVEMHLHSKGLGNHVSLINATCPRTPHIQFLQGHHIGLISRNDICDTPRRQPPIRAKAAAHVVGQYPGHLASFLSNVVRVLQGLLKASPNSDNTVKLQSFPVASRLCTTIFLKKGGTP
jgi:hypothetical protein